MCVLVSGVLSPDWPLIHYATQAGLSGFLVSFKKYLCFHFPRAGITGAVLVNQPAALEPFVPLLP